MLSFGPGPGRPARSLSLFDRPPSPVLTAPKRGDQKYGMSLRMVSSPFAALDTIHCEEETPLIRLRAPSPRKRGEGKRGNELHFGAPRPACGERVAKPGEGRAYYTLRSARS